MQSPYIFDIAFVLILAFMFWYGRRRGALRVLAGLFGTIAAWLAASSLSPRITPITIRIMTPYAHKAVASAAESMGLTPAIDATVTLGQAAGNLADTVSSLGEKLSSLGLPEQLSSLAEKLHISHSLENLLPGLHGNVSPTELMTEAMVNKLAPFITFFALFVLIKFVISIVVRILSLDWPIISSLNHFAGGAIGLLGGVLIVLALCAGIFAYGSPESTGITSQTLLSQSYTGQLVASIIHN